MTRRVLLPALLAILVGASPAHAWTWPADGPVLQAFRFGDDPYVAGLHRGIDVGGPLGSAVRAPAAGTVTFAGTVPRHGRTVTIETPDGYAVTLVHLGGIAVSRGAPIAEGTSVGTIGPSGEVEHRVPYVHLGVRVASDPQGYVDPLSLLPPRDPPPIETTTGGDTVASGDGGTPAASGAAEGPGPASAAPADAPVAVGSATGELAERTSAEPSVETDGVPRHADVPTAEGGHATTDAASAVPGGAVSTEAGVAELQDEAAGTARAEAREAADAPAAESPEDSTVGAPAPRSSSEVPAAEAPERTATEGESEAPSAVLVAVAGAPVDASVSEPVADGGAPLVDVATPPTPAAGANSEATDEGAESGAGTAVSPSAATTAPNPGGSVHAEGDEPARDRASSASDGWPPASGTAGTAGDERVGTPFPARDTTVSDQPASGSTEAPGARASAAKPASNTTPDSARADARNRDRRPSNATTSAKASEQEAAQMAGNSVRPPVAEPAPRHDDDRASVIRSLVAGAVLAAFALLGICWVGSRSPRDGRHCVHLPAAQADAVGRRQVQIGEVLERSEARNDAEAPIVDMPDPAVVPLRPGERSGVAKADVRLGPGAEELAFGDEARRALDRQGPCVDADGVARERANETRNRASGADSEEVVGWPWFDDVSRRCRPKPQPRHLVAGSLRPRVHERHVVRRRRAAERRSRQRLTRYAAWR